MKKLAIFCDGTWNTAQQQKGGVPSPTNVVKLSLRVARHDKDGVQQIVYYDQGVGTGNIVDRIKGGARGDGLLENLYDAYRFLMHNYEPGDEIYAFGFSRGAFTVRSVVGMIRKCGILQRGKDDLYKAARDLYRNYESPSDTGPTAFRAAHSVNGKDDTRIKFIGVWDTVGALGVPLRALQWRNAQKYAFHDVELSGCVKRAAQALAIDELRAPFEASRWAFVPKADQTIKQVWFAGDHCDIGGGHPKHNYNSHTDDGCGLSDITLEWMAAEAHDAELALEPLDQVAYAPNPLPLATQHYSLSLGYRLISRRNDRIIGRAASPNLQPTSESPLDSTQSVHPSVFQRWDELPSYRPPNLRDYFRRIEDPRGFS